MRLPAVDPAGQSSVWPGQQINFPSEMPNAFTPPGESLIPPPAEQEAEKASLPRGARAGMFQKAIFDGTWLPRFGTRGMGVTDLEVKSVLAVPCPTPDSPLLIIPGFAAHLFDGPTGTDMPPQLYDSYVQFRWLHRFSPSLACDLSFTPNMGGDYASNNAYAFRPTGYAAVAWTWSPQIQVILGAGYFNRLSVGVIPIGGVIWTPNEDICYEFLFPRPKLAHRIRPAGEVKPDAEHWVYLAAEFGGGAWAFENQLNQSDVVDYSDYRVSLGWERKVPLALCTRLEIGYVFGRKVQYQSDRPGFNPTDTLMVRGGVSY